MKKWIRDCELWKLLYIDLNSPYGNFTNFSIEQRKKLKKQLIILIKQL
jgi:hypothetical protein